MNKAEFLSAIYDILLTSGKRKPVYVPKQQFTITDDEGHSHTFSVRRKDRKSHYTLEDVKNITDALAEYIIDAVKHGEEVYFPQIGTFHAQFRAARKTRIPNSREWVTIPEHYVPKVEFAPQLKRAALIYESFKEEGQDRIDVPKKKRGRGRPSQKQIEEYDSLVAMAELDNKFPQQDEEDEVTADGD